MVVVLEELASELSTVELAMGVTVEEVASALVEEEDSEEEVGPEEQAVSAITPVAKTNRATDFFIFSLF